MCDEEGGEISSSVGLYVKQTLISSILSRLYTFVSGQQAIKWACIRYSSALGGKPFPKPLKIGLGVWSVIAAYTLWILASQVTIGQISDGFGGFGGRGSWDDLSKIKVRERMVTQLLTEWLVLEWLETIATCAIGLHDTKLKIDMDRDTAGADGEGGEESETVENPTAAKDDKKEKKEEKKKKEKKKKEKKTAE